MTICELLRTGLACLFTAAALFTVFVGILGTYRFRFALNRMHTASMVDTMGMLLMMLGLILVYGFDFASLKLALIVVFMWVASPISSHLIAELETLTDPELKDHLTVEDQTGKKEEH